MTYNVFGGTLNIAQLNSTQLVKTRPRYDRNVFGGTLNLTELQLFIFSLPSV